jgi:serine/threonine protein kinase
MTISPEKWETVKDLFDSALKLDSSERPAFLQENCPDAEARAEVERLLDEHDQAGAFLSNPVLSQFPSESEVPTPTQRLSQGEVLAGRFRIIRFIAGGGMGEVYEAEDEELRERVAVKTIRPEILVQPNALTRFKREVHLARKVTHRNVCRIFDLFRHKPDAGSVQEEIVFISMELLYGKTLGARLKESGPMSVGEASPLVGQMASALTAAHAVGIVHRDFKPGNVVLVGVPGQGGVRAVVTDFGLALQSLTSDETASLSTGQGLLGTPAYMSPEQLEGRPATTASDIYALGLVIYEMVTGARPFQGDTPISAALKRLSEAPIPPRKFQPELSSAWESVIMSCLERHPEKRFASAAEVASALESAAELRAPPKRLKRDTDSVARQDVTARLPHPLKPRSWLKWSVVTASIALTIAVLIFGYRSWHKRVGQEPKGNLKLRQLTASSAESFIEWAVISPDGKYLAYVEKGGPLFLSSVETGEARVLTPASGDIAPQGWFPDGTHLLALKIWEHSLWKVSVLTGTISKLRDNVGGGCISPDGHIMYWDEEAHEFWIMGPDGQGSRRFMVIDPTDEPSDFSWAPTGQRFAYIITRRRPNAEVETLIESRDVEGRQHPTVILSNVTLNMTGLRWLPDGRLIYSLTEEPPNQRDSNLWVVKVDPAKGVVRGDPERLTNWSGFATSWISVTADGKRLVFIKTHTQQSIYLAPLGRNRMSGLGKVHRLTSDTWEERVDAWARDGRAVYVSSNRSGKWGIYRQDIHQQAPEPVISGREDYFNARLSPDGASLLYTATAKRGSPEPLRLMSMPVDGGPPSVLASGDYKYECALPPSTSCVLSEEKGDQLTFYLLDSKHGRAAEPFKSINMVYDWSLSPDGQHIALTQQNNKAQIQILSLSKDTVVRQLDLGKWTQLQSISWSADGSGLYVTAFSPSMTLLSASLDGSVRVLFQQGHNWLCCPKAAPNGQLLAFTAMEVQRDAEMIEKF